MEYPRNNSFRSRRQQRFGKREGGKNFKFLVLIIVIFIIFYFIYNSGSKTEQSAVAGITASDSSLNINPSPSPSPSAAANYKTLQQTIEKSLEGTSGTYGVYVKNLKTGESYSYNDNKTFEAGSLYKLWTMAVVMNQIEAGDLEEDQKLSQGIAVLNRKFSIDPALAEQTQGTITLTVKEALSQMITISHNYAALLLTEKIKLSTVAKWLETKGFNNSKVGTDGDAPTTTPSDIAIFLEHLYNGEFGDADSTAKMITLLKAQQLNNKLPLKLPQGTVIAHKTGELGWFSHDAGIVYSDKGDYLIVVMSESSSPKGAEERIADLSLNVFNYFKKK
jgi:beta-lactamase class A